MKKNKQFVVFTAFSFIFSLGLLAQQKPYQAIAEMIKQNATSIENPTYKVPGGTVNSSTYLSSAITAGDAVSKPLSYFSTSATSNYYINYSLTPTLLERGKPFKLVLTSNKTMAVSSVNAFVFADWDRDGKFESNLGKHSINNLNNDVAGILVDVNIPKTAKLGKTRIRVHYTSNNPSIIEADGNLNSGYIYDFVVFITEKTIQSNLLLSTSANNSNYGLALIRTKSASGDGRFPSGTIVEVEAIKNDPMTSFVGWSNGTSILSTDEKYSFPITENTYLIAIFKTLTATLEAPQISTAENPIWYQIKNAQTDVRLDRFIAYSETIPSGYFTNLRIEKPEDFTDKFLWRLEASENGMVKLLNKGSNKQIFAPSNEISTVNMTVAEQGSNFFITASGHVNGSYSIKLNNQNDRLLNGGMQFNIVLYNAGVGTGSGWYFYRVPIITSTQFTEKPYIKYRLNQGKLTIDGTSPGDKIGIYNLLGQMILSTQAIEQQSILNFREKGAHIITISNGGRYKSVKKIVF